MKKLKIFFLSLGLIGMSLNSVEALDNKEFEEPKQTYSAPVRQKMGVDILPKHEEGQTSQDKKPVLFVMGVDGIYGPLFEKMIEE